MCIRDRRKVAWNRLATELPADLLEAMAVEHNLEDVLELAEKLSLIHI